jgi:hypothetical protein
MHAVRDVCYNTSTGTKSTGRDEPKGQDLRTTRLPGQKSAAAAGCRGLAKVLCQFATAMGNTDGEQKAGINRHHGGGKGASKGFLNFAKQSHLCLLESITCNFGMPFYNPF